MERRTFLTGAAAAALATGLTPRAEAQGGPPEKAKLVLGVGGKGLLYYLPLTIAERRNFFKEEGLEVEINDFGGGARSLQALVGGSVDVVTGAYEHTIRMQAKAQDIRAVCELGRFPAIVIAVRKDKAGLRPTDAAFIGVGGGAGAVAAMKKGEIDVISHLDPVVAKLEADGDVLVLIDTRTEAGTRALFGGSNPAAVLYTRGDFIEKNPATTQRLVNAFMKSLKWLASATPEDVADTVPTEYHLGDKALYLRAVKNSLESYSRTGLVPQAGMASIWDELKTLDPELQGANVDLAKTFDDRFVRAAAV